MASNCCSLRLIAKFILSSYALFVIYICTTFTVSSFLNTRSTHFTYLTVDLFAELHEPTVYPSIPAHVFSYIFALVSIVSMECLLFVVVLSRLPCFPRILHYAPEFVLENVGMVCMLICMAKLARGTDAPVPVYFGLALVTIVSIWFKYDLCSGADDQKHKKAQAIDVECGKMQNKVVDSSHEQHNS